MNKQDWTSAKTWTQTGLAVVMMLLPLTANGMTFESEKNTAELAAPTAPLALAIAPALAAPVAPVAPLAPVAIAPRAVAPAVPALSPALSQLAAGTPAIAGTPSPTDLTGAEEELTLGAPKSERGILSWIAMALLGCAAFGALVLMRKKKSNLVGGRPAMELVESIRVGAKHQISLVRVPGATLVLGVTEKGISTLAELPEDLQHLEKERPEESRLETRSEASIALEEEAPNPFLDRVLNLSSKRDVVSTSSARPRPSDQERRAVLKRLEQYRQGI